MLLSSGQLELARTYRRHGTRCSGIAQEDATFPFAFADGSVLDVLAIASDTHKPDLPVS